MSNAATNLEEHRSALLGHCYRLLGSAVDADEAVQETFLRAWRALERFEGRSALKTWLYSIATNVCLDAIADRKRRIVPYDESTANNFEHDLVERPRTHWIEPVPDDRVIPEGADPVQRAILRQSIRLAFVAALQHLPPKQRAALLLTEVVGLSAAETAECLETSVPAINSALQRARAALAARSRDSDTGALSTTHAELLARYVDAFERYDLDSLMRLLRDDVIHCMPPYALWLQGPSTIRDWMLKYDACRGSKLVPTSANGVPAFAQYRLGGPGRPRQAWALILLELSGDRIARVHNFLDVQTLFPIFGLPLELAE